MFFVFMRPLMMRSSSSLFPKRWSLVDVKDEEGDKNGSLDDVKDEEGDKNGDGAKATAVNALSASSTANTIMKLFIPLD